MTIIFLRVSQFFFLLMINYILVNFLPLDESSKIARLLIGVSLVNQALFGPLGMYFLIRLSGENENQIMKLAISFLSLTAFISSFFLILALWGITNDFFTILAYSFAQCVTALISSIVGVKRSVKASILINVAVAILFFVLVSALSFQDLLDNTTWLTTFTAVNLFVFFVIKIKYFYDFSYLPRDQLGRVLIFKLDGIKSHTLGFLSLTTLIWFTFIESRAQLFRYDITLNLEVLQVFLFVAFVTGAAELVYNTAFLTKVFRHISSNEEFSKYVMGLTFCMIGCVTVISLVSPILDKYYFPDKFVNVMQLLPLVLCIATAHCLSNSVLNQAARKNSFLGPIKFYLLISAVIYSSLLFSNFHILFFLLLFSNLTSGLIHLKTMTSSIKNKFIVFHIVLNLLILVLYIETNFLSANPYLSTILGLISVGIIALNDPVKAMIKEFLDFD